MAPEAEERRRVAKAVVQGQWGRDTERETRYQNPGVAVQNVERSRTSKVRGSCQRLAVHVSASWSLCRAMAKHARAGNCSVQRRGSKSRSSLQRAEMIDYVILSPRGS